MQRSEIQNFLGGMSTSFNGFIGTRYPKSKLKKYER
jgi:hypothetical protein